MKHNFFLFLMIGVYISATVACDKPHYKAQQTTTVTSNYYSRSSQNLDTSAMDTSSMFSLPQNNSYKVESQEVESQVEKATDATVFSEYDTLSNNAFVPFEQSKEYLEIEARREADKIARQFEDEKKYRKVNEFFEADMNRQIETRKELNKLNGDFEFEKYKRELSRSTDNSSNYNSNYQNNYNYGNGIGSNSDAIQVDGFNKSNGTQVAPYYRTAPNSTTLDNFSTSPNYNPYNGKTGTRRN